MQYARLLASKALTIACHFLQHSFEKQLETSLNVHNGYRELQKSISREDRHTHLPLRQQSPFERI